MVPAKTRHAENEGLDGQEELREQALTRSVWPKACQMLPSASFYEFNGHREPFRSSSVVVLFNASTTS